MQLEDPSGITIDSAGNVYVPDGKDADVHVFSAIN
ncbi:MAG: SBBP repeat-containing protein [Nitrososphaeraceae archaeon]